METLSVACCGDEKCTRCALGLETTVCDHITSRRALNRTKQTYKYTILNISDKSETVNLSLMYSNRAACHLKTGDLPGAVKDCTASLALIPHTVKPLLRRASAYEHLER